MYRMGIAANVISVFSLLLAITSGIFFGLGGLHFSLAGCLLAYLFILFDCVDGEVARLTGTAGGSGNVLEELSVVVLFASIIAGVGFGAARTDGNQWHTIAAFVCISSSWGWGKVVKFGQTSSAAGKIKVDMISEESSIERLRSITQPIFSPPGMILFLLLLILCRFFFLRYAIVTDVTPIQRFILQTEWTGIYIWLQAFLHITTLIFKTRKVMLAFNRNNH